MCNCKCKQPTAISVRGNCEEHAEAYELIGGIWSRMEDSIQDVLRNILDSGMDIGEAVDCLEAVYLADPEERDGERDGWDAE